jgi:hypothetical protein
MVTEPGPENGDKRMGIHCDLSFLFWGVLSKAHPDTIEESVYVCVHVHMLGTCRAMWRRNLSFEAVNVPGTLRCAICCAVFDVADGRSLGIRSFEAHKPCVMGSNGKDLYGPAVSFLRAQKRTKTGRGFENKTAV